MAKRPQKDARPIRERPPNPDDDWLEVLRDGCARAMATHLKNSCNTDRAIRSLTLVEMKNLAEACAAHWIVAVSKKLVEEDLSPTLRAYENLLLG
jgi:hypothetical protein